MLFGFDCSKNKYLLLTIGCLVKLFILLPLKLFDIAHEGTSLSSLNGIS
jgi:hypothetical protein